MALGHVAMGRDTQVSRTVLTQLGEPSLTHTAKRGSARALEQWSPTFTTYLNQQLPHHNFITVPLGFNEVFPAVAQKDVDFLYNTAPTPLTQANKHSHTSTLCCTALPTHPTLPVWSESLASPLLPQWSTTGAVWPQAPLLVSCLQE